ncbi:MAG: tetratricopeptide repeat protein [Planctomycetota bacterium]|jgi:tetratricopeptide (TPR) repeat protein
MSKILSKEKVRLTKKTIIVCIGCCIIACGTIIGKTYQSEHFIIQSDLSPLYMEIILQNSETYFINLENLFFANGGTKPITIYYSKTQSQTQTLFSKHGISGKAHYGLYSSNGPSIYTHRLMDNGSLSGLGTLFHEITHHFVHVNYANAPSWFNEGLATITGEQARIVKGKLVMGKPNPWREHALREMIEKGYKIDVKHLTSLSERAFRNDRNNYHPVRALFYWLHENGHLREYLVNSKEKGYGLSVLEQTVGNSSSYINSELLAFIEKHCYAGAYLYDAYRTKDPARKQELLLKALELKPGYKPALLELARHYYHSGHAARTRELITNILEYPHSIECGAANKLMAHTYYSAKDYARAIEYYEQALDYSGYDEYKYEVNHWMGNCYIQLKDYNKAEEAHSLFLSNNWEPERLSKLVNSSKAFLNWMEKHK